MYRQIVIFAMLAVIGVLASPTVDQTTSNAPAHNYENEKDIDKAESKQDLLQYEEPAEYENPLDYVMNLVYLIFGVTFKTLVVKVLQGLAAVLALLIVTASAISYSF